MRALSFSLVSLGSSAVAAVLLAAGSMGACAPLSAPAIAMNEDASLPTRDAGLVEPPTTRDDAGAGDAGLEGPRPSCETYCDRVETNCDGPLVQYASKDECMAFCAAFPEGTTGETDTDSLACRQYYASTPAQTDPESYCLAAGPFGGGTCGDRCTAFCSLALAVCAGDGGALPYVSMPACVTACATFGYRDAATDGGGEGPFGPDSGDTLNCRMHELRDAVREGTNCRNVGLASDACR